VNKSAYTRPDKPRKMVVNMRKEIPEREPLTIPKAVTVDASTECFTTPGPIIELMIDYADIEDGQLILEPSAGTGAIASYLLKNYPFLELDVIELNLTLKGILKSNQHNLVASDFLEFETKQGYDRILMNPPFRKLQDIDHVLKAYECLKLGGRLVSIMGAGAFFNSQKKAIKFRDWLYEIGGEFYDLPENSFEGSGTGVNSKIVIIDKQSS